LLYIQATSVEFVLETIEELLGADNQILFIWDSLALTPAISDVEGDFNPQSSMAVKARILAKGMSKLTLSIANTKSTFLVLNQLKTNITRSPSEAMTTPYVTPGGKAMIYAYSLRIWLTGRKAKASFVLDDNGFRIGSEKVSIQDDESLFEAVKGSDNILQAGAWFTMVFEDGSTEKFQASKWADKMQSDKFRQRVYQIIDEEIIYKFHNRQGKAEDFYEPDEG